MYAEKNTVNEWGAALSEAAAGAHYPKLFKRVQQLLAVPSRKRKAVTTLKINKTTKAGDNIIVPRKVLFSGKLDHKISIAALEYSASARKHLEESGCTIVGIREMAGKSRINIVV